MDTRLAELSRTMDQQELGRRIRNARVAAGLTQGRLAADDVTSAYVSRIEDGQRRPDFKLLIKFAERMQISLRELLEPEESPARLELLVELDHAELELAGGNSYKVVAELPELLDRVTTGGWTDLVRRLDLIRATALEGIGELNQAIVILEDIRETPTATPEWVRAMVALSRCYREVGDFDRAISAGGSAHEVIGELELDGLTESIQLSVTVASAHLMRGDLDEAMRLCLRAIDAAEKAESPIAKASALWNASLIESRKGASPLALDLARRALTYFELAEDARNLARLRGHVADMQLAADPPDPEGALETLQRAFDELDWSAGSAVDRFSQLHTRARAHMLLGDFDEASRDIDLCLEILPDDAALGRAYAFALRGELDLKLGDSDSARRAFLDAVRVLTALGADREAAQLWYELGEQLKAMGEIQAALDALSRAAASTGLRTSSITSTRVSR